MAARRHRHVIAHRTYAKLYGDFLKIWADVANGLGSGEARYQL